MRQSCFALKGGTALNLFLRDMPRISVDVDLTYLPLKSRDESLADIRDGLNAMAGDIEKNIGDCKVRRELLQGYTVRLQVASSSATITIEPNLILRGCVYGTRTRDLVSAAQLEFQTFTTALTLSDADLYGGKLCAALDRQHPRDLFDVKQLLDAEGLGVEIRRAFVVYLAGHDRPMHELLDPLFQDLRAVYSTQFAGMCRQPVSLPDLLAVRERLVGLIRETLDAEERRFLVSMKRGEPDWNVLGIPHLSQLPALKWKLLNIARMDRHKHALALDKLRRVLDT
jgi:predicted nucleotidyltransferase component of viral defense system